MESWEELTRAELYVLLESERKKLKRSNHKRTILKHELQEERMKVHSMSNSLQHFSNSQADLEEMAILRDRLVRARLSIEEVEIQNDALRSTLRILAEEKNYAPVETSGETTLMHRLKADVERFTQEPIPLRGTNLSEGTRLAERMAVAESAAKDMQISKLKEDLAHEKKGRAAAETAARDARDFAEIMSSKNETLSQGSSNAIESLQSKIFNLSSRLAEVKQNLEATQKVCSQLEAAKTSALDESERLRQRSNLLERDDERSKLELKDHLEHFHTYKLKMKERLQSADQRVVIAEQAADDESILEEIRTKKEERMIFELQEELRKMREKYRALAGTLSIRTQLCGCANSKLS